MVDQNGWRRDSRLACILCRSAGKGKVEVLAGCAIEGGVEFIAVRSEEEDERDIGDVSEESSLVCKFRNFSSKASICLDSYSSVISVGRGGRFIDARSSSVDRESGMEGRIGSDGC